MAEINPTIEYLGPKIAEPFALVRFAEETSARYTAQQLAAAGAAGHAIMLQAWRRKLVPRTLSGTEVASKVVGIEELTEKLASPDNGTEYWLAYSGYKPESIVPKRTSPQAIALLRVEVYKPRRPFAAPYPNITDLESTDGQVNNIYKSQAAALVYNALLAMRAKMGSKDRKVAAYEIQGSDGVPFYEDEGFHDTGNRAHELVGDGIVTYVHMEAPSQTEVITTIGANDPWLLGK